MGCCEGRRRRRTATRDARRAEAADVNQEAGGVARAVEVAVVEAVSWMVVLCLCAARVKGQVGDRQQRDARMGLQQHEKASHYDQGLLLKLHEAAYTRNIHDSDRYAPKAVPLNAVLLQHVQDVVVAGLHLVLLVLLRGRTGATEGPRQHWGGRQELGHADTGQAWARGGQGGQAGEEATKPGHTEKDRDARV